jgi:DNA polymerase (family 10)
MINMENFEITKILREIAVFLEMDDVRFKPRAYGKAASSIEAMEEDVEEVYSREGLRP